jgi:excisionase family DNA binding protein
MKKTPEQRKLVTVSEAAAYLRIDQSSLYRMLHRGEIRGTKSGWVWRIDLSELRRLVVKIDSRAK